VSVVDASLLIDVVVGLPAGKPWRRWMAASERLAAPDCIGVELGRYLRRHMLAERLTGADARRALTTVRALGLDLYPTAPLLADALEHRNTITFDDALYVVLAQRLDEPLATTDARLARAAAAIGVEITTPAA
jgi:predicted nucleic acid-binding protein